MSTDASLQANISAPPARATAPVTAHPWFPAIVALWFAALFGLTSLALAPALLERIVVASGIDAVIAAAAPPLGQTARLLLALGLAGLGAVLGLLLGRCLAPRPTVSAPRRRAVARADAEDDSGARRMDVRGRLAQLTGQGNGPRDFDDLPKLRARDRHPDAPNRKPLSPGEVLADAEVPERKSLDSVLRRRAASSEAEHAPAPFSGPAPVPGDGWGSPAPFVAPQEPIDQPLELGGYAAEDAPAPFAAPAPEPFAAPEIAELPEPVALPVALAVSEPLAEPMHEPLNSSAIAESPLDSLGVVQLSERLAIAMRARRERDARRDAERIRAEVARADEPPIVLPSLAAVRAVVPEPEPPAEPAAIVPEARLARFGDAPAPLAMPHAFRFPHRSDDVDEDEAMPALARSLSLAPSVPREAIVQPAEAPVPEPLARGLEILARRSGQPVRTDPVPEADAETVAEAGAETEDGELDAEALEDGYSSLLDLSRPPGLNGAGYNGIARHESVRIEEPESDEIEPVVVFPGQTAATARPLPGPFSAPRASGLEAPAAPFAVQGAAEPATSTLRDPAETDRALKAALASLQRISGTR